MLHGPRLPPTKPGIDICHSLAQCKVNEAPAQAEVGEDNEQLPQHGVEPEQRLKQRSSTVGNGANPTPPSLQQVGPRCSHRTAQGKACRESLQPDWPLEAFVQQSIMGLQWRS